MFDFFLIDGYRMRTIALVDSRLSPDGYSIRLNERELSEYLSAKKVYESYQRRFRHYKRYGW
jgi:hypothetical protein